jgi:hypothetical protein
MIGSLVPELLRNFHLNLCFLTSNTYFASFLDAHLIIFRFDPSLHVIWDCKEKNGEAKRLFKYTATNKLTKQSIK